MSQKFPHINFIIREGHGLPNMFGLSYTEAGLNEVNLDYYKSVAERHPNLVVKFPHLKDLDDVDTFNISGVDIGKER